MKRKTGLVKIKRGKEEEDQYNREGSLDQVFGNGEEGVVLNWAEAIR